MRGCLSDAAVISVKCVHCSVRKPLQSLAHNIKPSEINAIGASEQDHDRLLDSVCHLSSKPARRTLGGHWVTSKTHSRVYLFINIYRVGDEARIYKVK